MVAPSIRILVVEDDQLIHDLLEAALVEGGFARTIGPLGPRNRRSKADEAPSQ